MEMLESTYRSFLVVFTKVDLLSNSEYHRLLDWSIKELPKYKMASPFAHFTSAK